MPDLPDHFRSSLRAALAALVLLWGVAVPAHAAEEFLQPEQAFRLAATKSDAGGLQLTWSIAPGYYLYRDRMAVTASPSGSAVETERPPGVRKDDPNFGEMEVFHDAVTVKVHRHNLMEKMQAGSVPMLISMLEQLRPAIAERPRAAD